MIQEIVNAKYKLVYNNENDEDYEDYDDKKHAADDDNIYECCNIKHFAIPLPKQMIKMKNIH